MFKKLLFFLLFLSLTVNCFAAGNDANALTVLHMNGTDASTTFTDDAEGGANTWTASGNAQLDTAQQKFGTASGLFDGDGDYISTGDSADWAFGSGDFTIDFWVRIVDVTATGTFYNQFNNSTQNSIRFYFSGTTMYFLYSTTGSNELGGSVGLHGISNNTWAHIALVRYGNTVTAYVDGVAKGTRDVTGITLWNSTTSLYVGFSETQATYLNGWTDEYRISNIARWTSNFTPPTAAYCGGGDTCPPEPAAPRGQMILLE